MNRPRSSRKRYLSFVEDYRRRRLDEAAESAAPESAGKPRREHRKYVREYLRWLWPHRFAVGALFALALVGAGLQMVEPLFMRYHRRPRAADPGPRSGDAAACASTWPARCSSSLIVVSNLIGALKRLPAAAAEHAGDAGAPAVAVRAPAAPARCPKLWDMKTGGILSRLTGDVDTTTGLLQMAIVSPSVSVDPPGHRRRDAAGAQLAAGADGAGDHPGRDADQLHLRAARPAHLPVGPQGRGTDRRPGGRDVLRDSRRPGLPPRSARAARLHARAAHRAAQGAVRAAPRAGDLDVLGTAAGESSTSSSSGTAAT